ncbi:ribosomal protein L10 [Rivularia sp. PCC 7116]|uniref:50S ribosomal protein L10 n=1 Tax=Rivularia sp. PCC 7116 TaxID=373994 RepID=UPI00029F0CA3|nr:50S ribosomal protein L10 [Rivularia sp. PCC 7116]AFY53422.1 ribosomal protein L10 [Rivularia sp. PCC 7116]
MGRTLANKKEIVADLKELLNKSSLAIVIDYEGLSVSQITDLRNKMRPTGTVCKRTKNTLMRIAVEEDTQWQPMTQYLQDSSVFLLVEEELKDAIKAYEDFQKATKKTKIRGGVLEGQALTVDEVKALKELPSKQELMARIAGGINAVATRLAVGVNQVPTKLATGINEVPNSLARALQAVSQKEDGGDSGDS